MKVRTEARREAIVREATQLFMEMGFERATMGELTNRMGGSKATLYGYFPSKEELFAAVVEELGEAHLSHAVVELQQLAAVGLEAGLNRFALKMLTLMQRDDALALYRMVLGEAGRSNIGETFVEVGPRRCMRALAEAFGAAMARGEMAPGPQDTLAMLFIGLVKSENEFLIYSPRPRRLTRNEIEATAQRAVQLFLGGYRAVGAP